MLYLIHLLFDGIKKFYHKTIYLIFIKVFNRKKHRENTSFLKIITMSKLLLSRTNYKYVAPNSSIRTLHMSSTVYSRLMYVIPHIKEHINDITYILGSNYKEAKLVVEKGYNKKVYMIKIKNSNIIFMVYKFKSYSSAHPLSYSSSYNEVGTYRLSRKGIKEFKKELDIHLN